MKRSSLYFIFGLILQIFLFTNVNGCLVSVNPVQELNKHWPTNEWKYMTPEEYDLNPKYFNQITDVIENRTYPLSSLVIANNMGYLLYEWHTMFYDENKTYETFSVTKAIIGLLIGIAIDKGFIESVDIPISRYFNSSEWQNPGPRKEAITIRHLLTFTTGFEYDELSTSYGDPNNLFNIWKASSDWVQFTLDLPMNADPGQQFTFCAPASHLLSVILSKATGQTPLEFGNQFLFKPIGINIDVWKTEPNKIHNDGGNGLYMSTQDMVRIGYLMYNNGTWNGTQIISKEWIKELSQPHFHTFYGYQWWILPEEEFGKGAIWATGNYETSALVILREYGLILSIVGSYPEGVTAEWPRKLITDYLIPASLPYNLNSTDQSTSSFNVLFILPSLFTLIYLNKRKNHLKD
jgi:CubicO group peptidase (beta-lactamase class C family)